MSTVRDPNGLSQGRTGIILALGGIYGQEVGTGCRTRKYRLFLSDPGLVKGRSLRDRVIPPARPGPPRSLDTFGEPLPS